MNRFDEFDYIQDWEENSEQIDEMEVYKESAIDEMIDTWN